MGLKGYKELGAHEMKILHISDLHMDTKSNFSIADMILGALDTSKKQGFDLLPEIILVTGDFTNNGNALEFESAKQVLKKIKSSIKSVEECIIVPGNHDYIWKDNGKDVSKDQMKINFSNFKKICEQDKLCKSNSSIKNKNLEQELDSYLITHTFIKQQSFAVLIIGMNSDMLESVERAGQGYFDKGQHNACQSLISHYKEICENENMSLITIAAFHHHILPVSSVERNTVQNPDKFSLTLDARRTLNFFMDNGVRIAVHGHQHQPSIVCWKDEMKRSCDSVYVISAGSMTQDRGKLGDISKNNFMIYDVEENNVKVYCFENSQSDWDVMELCHEPYNLLLKNPYDDIQCKVNENARPPQGIELINYRNDKDTSDLYYLFLNVVDCNQAREEIINFSEQYKKDNNNFKICGVHYLYGKYDVLVKYRATENDRFNRLLQEYLKRKKAMGKPYGSYFMNVSYENQNFKKIQKIPLLQDPSAYLHSTWNMATLAVHTAQKMTVEDFFNKLNFSINLFNSENNTKIEDIIRNYAVGQDQVIIFELFISCYQFPMLTCFTNMIEDIIRDYGIDKYTHIIYYFDERCL